MNPLWKQSNPVDQLVVIRMAIEGWIDILTIQSRTSEINERVTPFIEQITELEPFLRGEKQWTLQKQ